MVIKITTLVMALLNAANAASSDAAKKCSSLRSFIQSDLDTECQDFEPIRLQGEKEDGAAEEDEINPDVVSDYGDEAYGEELTPDNPGQATLDAEANLWKWNFWMVISHLSQALLIVAAATFNDNVGNFKLPLVTHFLNWDKGRPVQAT